MICETKEEFWETYCKYCGSQRCEGVYNEEWREGCPYYKNYLKTRGEK